MMQCCLFFSCTEAARVLKLDELEIPQAGTVHAFIATIYFVGPDSRRLFGFLSSRGIVTPQIPGTYAASDP